MNRLALMLVLSGLLPAALAQTAASRARPRTPPPCRAVTEQMLSRDLVLPEGCYTLDHYVNVEHPLTVSPGTTITFGQGAVLAIETNGSLNAVGTAEKPIVFRGKDATAGSWGGLVIESRSSHNSLSYFTIEDAGAKGSDDAAIKLAPGSQLGIDHSTVRRALGSGIYSMDDADFSRFEANHFDHTETPLRLKASDLIKMDAGSTFADNTNNVVTVAHGEGNVKETALWRKLTVPYRFDGSVEVEAKLTIEAGAQLQFREALPLNVNSNGSLTAIGTAADPIIFTATDETPGYWAGVFFESKSSSNVLRHVEVRFGGSKSGAVGGAVGITHGASATVQSSTISSSPIGIYVASEATLNPDASTSNQFKDVGQNIFTER